MKVLLRQMLPKKAKMKLVKVLSSC